MKLPMARNANTVVQETGRELLIYNLTSNKAYCLNETASVVFNACGNQSSFEELNRRYNYPDDLIYLTLAELKKNNLLENYESNHFAGLSRREAIKRVGPCAVALPVIMGITAPEAAQAASACQEGQSCTGSNFTQSSCCTNQYCFQRECVNCVPLGQQCGGNAACCSLHCSSNDGNPGMCIP